jgi:long-subunit acyl-CoA synthetase (AMP-forming)
MEVTDDLINSEGSKAMVLKWLGQAATDAKLKGFERIRKVFCIRQNFGELGLTTSTFKLKRNETKAHFQTVLNELYVGMD